MPTRKQLKKMLIYSLVVAFSSSCTYHYQEPAPQPPPQNPAPSPSGGTTEPQSGKSEQPQTEEQPASPQQAKEEPKEEQPQEEQQQAAAPAVPPISPIAPLEQKPEEKPAEAANGTPATQAVENYLKAVSEGKRATLPAGSTISYTLRDMPRIQYYKSFMAGSLSTDDFTRLLFKDSDFNRSVAVVGDLYKQDKLNGSIPTDKEAKFQELGQRVGNAVLIYNRNKRADHYSNLIGATIVGTIIGAVAGGLFMREDMIPVVIKTKVGDRIPGWVRDAAVGGVAGGTVVLITMESYHIINSLAHPEMVYNANPILDTTTVQTVKTNQ